MHIRRMAGQRRRIVRRGLRLLGLALAAIVIVVAVRTAVSKASPTFVITVGDTRIAESRDTAWLTAAARDWADRQQAKAVALQAQGQRWAFRLSELGLTVDTARLDRDLARVAAHPPWWSRLPWAAVRLPVTLTTAWDEGRLAAALAPVRSALERPPVQAELRIQDRRPVIIPEIDGVAVDSAAVLHALSNLGDKSALDLPLVRKQPDVTQASLEKMRIRTLISEWTTNYDTTIPRADNVERAARAFAGMLIKPGAILSYNAAVGPVDAASGWQEAWVIENGQLVPGVGGGVCQVATTLYGAALRADLEIMERHPHQLAVWYIPPSQDAAITPGWEDLKFRNTTLGYLYIETETRGGAVTFRLYGDVSPGQEVKIESQVTGSRPFPTREVVDHRLRPGQRLVQTEGHDGLLSEGYRMVYREGQLVRRELLSKDSYLPTAQVVAVGH